LENKYKYLSAYLIEILNTKKHFNIDDELQKYNIEKREQALKIFLEKNPFGYKELNFELYKKDYNQFEANLLNNDNDYFAQVILDEIFLINDYKRLWNQQRENSLKNKRGKYRQELHRELLLNFFSLNWLKNNNIEINEDFNICFVKNKVLFASSLTDILEVVDKLNDNSDVLFYRGHADSSYRLLPSIYRGNAPFYEKEIFYDTISTIPEEFKNTNSTFEILTIFQHFGTPTRLLDITTNPLVALFFACKSSNKNGELLTFDIKKEDIKLFDSDTVSVVTNLVKLDYDFNILGKVEEKGDKHFDELVHKIRNEKSYFDNLVVKEDLNKSFFVKPKLDNPRIIKQSGAFIVCGMDDVKYIPSKDVYDIERDKVISRIIISKNLKAKILKSLETFNISSGSLFPELSEVAGYIKNRYGVR
jgi:hypothetical protein